MKLVDIEKTLEHYRLNMGLKIVRKSRGSISKPVIERIERSDNYNLSSLFNYIEGMGMLLSINDIEIDSPETLGKFLKQIRENKNLSLSDVKWPGNHGCRDVSKLEEGCGSRNNLMKYIENLQENLDYKLIDVYGITKSVRS